MITVAEQLESAALQLPRSERARLAERLLTSLDEDAGIEGVWAEEVRSRVQELRSGSVKAIPGDEVFKDLERLYR